MSISETGAWLDHATAQVVYSPPEVGTQLVAPGCEIDPALVDLVASGGGAKPEKAVAKPPAEKRAAKK